MRHFLRWVVVVCFLAVGVAGAQTRAVEVIGNGVIQPEISISDVTLEEGDAGTTDFVFDVTLSGPSVQPITVNYATANGTATAPSDYGNTSGTLIFAPGVVLQTVTVSVAGDTTYENLPPDGELNETFFVNLSDPVNATLADNRGVGTIVGDDPVPVVTISDVTEEEGDTDQGFAFQLTLSNPSSQVVDVGYELIDGTARSGDDYDNTTLIHRFEPGETEKTINIGIVGDLILEPDETFTVKINAGGATVVDDTAIGTILNDDEAPTVSISNASVFEGNTPGQNVLEFQVTLSHESEQTVTIDWSTADGTATTPDDYPASSGQATIEFNDFFPNLTATITVPVNGDTLFEGDETLLVNLTGATNATIADGQGVGTIRNDDAMPFIDVEDVTEEEGNSGGNTFTFRVTLSEPSALPVTVDYAAQDNTTSGDFAPANGTLTFDPGQTEKFVDVVVSGDTTFEPDETFDVVLNNANGGTIFGSGLGTIVNDDPQPTISIGDVSRAEGDAGTTAFTFDVTLSNASSTQITVDFTTDGDSAEAPADYLSSSETVTFEPGQVLQTITVDVAGDLIFEEDETFFVNLSNAAGATIADAQGLGTIQNDDGAPAISINDVSLNEGDEDDMTVFAFDVTLSNPSATPVSVEFATVEGTAEEGPDYEPADGTLVFSPGDTSKTIFVHVTGELVFEGDETFTVVLSNPEGAAIADDTGLGTIVNDDEAPAITITDAEVVEGPGGTIEFVVRLSGESESPVTVSYITQDGSAVAPDDYAADFGTVTILPGQLQGSIVIDVAGDDAFEPDEDFFVNLTDPSGATIADGQGVGTIVNDDAAFADLTLTKTGPASVEAGQPIEYEITVTNVGPDAATNVVVTDTIPAGTTFVSATPSQGTCSGTTTVTCNVGTLADGAQATIDLVVTAPNVNGQISNTASATSDGSDATPAAGTAATFVTGAAATVAGVPTLSEWAMILMLMGVAAAAASRLKG